MTKFFTNFKRHRNFAFTMAEILLSLTIIGVVAAITLPSLTGNINERTWNTQRKALYARMSQAMALMPALNGFGSIDYNSSGSITNDTAGQAFITELGNVLKINNVCDNAHLEDCGIVSKFMPMGGNSEMETPKTLYALNGWFSSAGYTNGGYSITFSTLNTNAVAFETQNGESIVAYYNRNCRTEYLNEAGRNIIGESFGFPEASMCANFIYDLNGKKGPNTVGKDIGFITVLNSMDSIVVAPQVANANNANNNAYISWEGASSACTAQDSDSRLPNIYELQAMAINRNLIKLSSADYWSSTTASTDVWNVYAPNAGGVRHTSTKTGSSDERVRCVKR